MRFLTPGIGDPTRVLARATAILVPLSKWLVPAFVIAVLLAPEPAASSPRSGQSRDVVVGGYEYAARCPAAGYQDVVDRWGMDMCNCTSYVAWALHANRQRTDWFIGGAMDAWNWPHVARLAHIPVGRLPRQGSVAVWPELARPFGHVAYVTGVEKDGGIDVAEYNLPSAAGGRPYRFDVRQDLRPGGAIFIYPPARRSR